jgi:hypothetical protein
MKNALALALGLTLSLPTAADIISSYLEPTRTWSSATDQIGQSFLSPDQESILNSFAFLTPVGSNLVPTGAGRLYLFDTRYFGTYESISFSSPLAISEPFSPENGYVFYEPVSLLEATMYYVYSDTRFAPFSWGYPGSQSDGLGVAYGGSPQATHSYDLQTGVKFAYVVNGEFLLNGIPEASSYSVLIFGAGIAAALVLGRRRAKWAAVRAIEQ